MGAEEQRLLRALAEQLKLPLMEIARSAELAQKQSDQEVVLGSIRHTADATLLLIDSYLLGVRLAEQPMLELEPVAVSAVLQESAHKLYYVAKQYNCELEVDVRSKYRPVMADRQKLAAAYLSLGHAFLGTPPQEGHAQKVIFGAHASAKGLVTGVYSPGAMISSSDFMRGRALAGDALQPMRNLSAYAGAGIFVADNLLTKMHSPLKPSRHNKLHGLAATLVPSKQLSLM